MPSFRLVRNQTAREDSQGGRGGKGEKILTTEITEATEERFSPQRRRGTKEDASDAGKQDLTPVLSLPFLSG
jgi:hypothetical protein